MLADLEWWMYLFLVITFFITCVVLNYIVKKVNEAKLEERFVRMRQKVSTTQSTQVHGPLIEMETSKGSKSQSNTEKSHNSPQGISLVFNQEENMLTDKRRKELEESFTMINNTIDLRKHEILSLNAEASQDAEDTSTANKNESSTAKKSSIAKSSTLGISLKDSNVFNETPKEVGTQSFIKIAVDSIVGKIVDTLNPIDESQSEKPSLTDWIKDLLIRQVPKEDTPKSPDSSSNK